MSYGFAAPERWANLATWAAALPDGPVITGARVAAVVRRGLLAETPARRGGSPRGAPGPATPFS